VATLAKSIAFSTLGIIMAFAPVHHGPEYLASGNSLERRPVAGGVTMGFRVTSAAFADGADVPRQYTCDGADAPPPLSLSEPPDGVRSFAIIMDDPDAPKGTFTHWLAYDIPADGKFDATRGKTLRNGFGREGYGGPCPPPGHGPHRYHFTVYAVGVPSLTLRGQGRRDLEAALEGHTLGTARLTGRYERTR
jgi:Raf kinase inhibitor-like YbhB/YbcL family protein